METVNNNKENIKLTDIINALALLKAKESGLVDQMITNKEIGILGASSSQVMEVISQYEQGQITKEEAKEKIKKIVVVVVIAKTIEKVTDGVTKVLSTRLPAFAMIFEGVSKYVKNNSMKIAQKTVEIGTKLFNKAKEKLKAFFR